MCSKYASLKKVLSLSSLLILASHVSFSSAKAMELEELDEEFQDALALVNLKKRKLDESGDSGDKGGKRARVGNYSDQIPANIPETTTCMVNPVLPGGTEGWKITIEQKGPPSPVRIKLQPMMATLPASKTQKSGSEFFASEGEGIRTRSSSKATKGTAELFASEGGGIRTRSSSKAAKSTAELFASEDSDEKEKRGTVTPQRQTQSKKEMPFPLSKKDISYTKEQLKKNPGCVQIKVLSGKANRSRKQFEISFINPKTSETSRSICFNSTEFRKLLPEAEQQFVEEVMDFIGTHHYKASGSISHYWRFERRLLKVVIKAKLEAFPTCITKKLNELLSIPIVSADQEKEYEEFKKTLRRLVQEVRSLCKSYDPQRQVEEKSVAPVLAIVVPEEELSIENIGRELTEEIFLAEEVKGILSIDQQQVGLPLPLGNVGFTSVQQNFGVYDPFSSWTPSLFSSPYDVTNDVTMRELIRFKNAAKGLSIENAHLREENSRLKESALVQQQYGAELSRLNDVINNLRIENSRLSMENSELRKGALVQQQYGAELSRLMGVINNLRIENFRLSMENSEFKKAVLVQQQYGAELSRLKEERKNIDRTNSYLIMENSRLSRENIHLRKSELG